MQIRILTASQVRAALPMPEAIEAMRSAFSQLSAGDAEVPCETKHIPDRQSSEAIVETAVDLLPEHRLGTVEVAAHVDVSREFFGRARGVPSKRAVGGCSSHQLAQPYITEVHEFGVLDIAVIRRVREDRIEFTVPHWGRGGIFAI